MPPIIRLPPERVAYQTFKEKHPRIHGFLYQIVLLVITFECAIAISRYGPERYPAPSADVPRAILRRNSLPTGNSSTPHICINGAREDLVDLGSALTAITPYAILCPSTPFLIFALFTFLVGIIHFNILHKDDLFLSTGWGAIFTMTLVSIDWSNILVSLQIFIPMNIWSMTLASAIFHGVAKMCFPGWYARMRAAEEERKRMAEDERLKKLREREGGGDVEAIANIPEGEVGGDADEETPLNAVGRQ